MKPLTIQNTKLISRLTLTMLLCGSLIAQSASAARTPRRSATATSAQQQQSTARRRPATTQSTGQTQSSAPRRPRPQTGPSSVVIPTRPHVDPRPTRDPRPHVDPVPTFPGRPTRPPRPTVPVNPTVPTVPSNPTFPPSRPLPPSNPVPSANPLPTRPANPTPAPQNPLPTPEQGAPENAAPSDRIVPADEELAREVASDVQQLLDDGLNSFNDSFQSFGDDELVAESGLGDQLQSYQQSIRDDASLEQIAEQGRAAYDTLASLHSNEDGPAGLSEWAEGLAQNVSKMALMAAIDKSIGDALANGLGPANGPLGPMDLAPGVGGGGGGGPWGPGDLAPGGGGGGVGPWGPGDLAPGVGGGGGGGGLGPMGPGGLALPMGGGGGGFGFGWFGGFHIHLHVNFWFGHGWCPMICCPGLPWGHCCWIGPHVMCCGVGHFGHPCVCYGPPAYCGLPYCLVAPLPNALPHVNYLGRILLLNPAENVGEIHYLLSGDPHFMEAGMMQEMRRDVSVIRFDRGPGFGEARYTLRPGTYRFVVTEDGWDLVKVTFQATLDNTANASDFNLLLDGDPVTVPARSEQVVTSPYPLLVEFSNGSEVVGKQLADEKVYTIGINDSGKWDLFPGNAIASGAGEAGQMQVLAAAEGVEPPHAIDLPTE